MSEFATEYNAMEESELKEIYRNTTTEVEWLEYPRSVTVRVPFMEPQVFNVGDFITYDNQNDTGVMITKFVGSKEKSGPNGFFYLPWRDDPTRESGRWATLHVTLRGDSRYIICYPVGISNFGQHITWNTLKNINHLAPVQNPEYQKKLELVTSPTTLDKED
jgi:hypothetical protein